MSFSSQRNICYLVNQFYGWLLIRCIKTLAMLKRWRFGDSGSDETKTRGSKYQHLDKRDAKKENGLDNKKGNGLDKDEGEIEDGRYVPPPFVSLPPFLQKVSNRPSDLGKGTKSLKYIVYIPKICYSRSANFVLEFSSRRGSKAQKKSLLVA